jgi:hypothetical protein
LGVDGRSIDLFKVLEMSNKYSTILLKISLIAVLALAALATNAENPPVKGGCLLGESQRAHGLSQADAIERMKSYARLYVKDYGSFRRAERRSKTSAYEYLKLKKWKQAEVIGFTGEQRKFMYITVGGELAAGRATVEQLPGYAASIDQQIFNLELELGCEAIPEE